MSANLAVPAGLFHQNVDVFSLCCCCCCCCCGWRCCCVLHQMQDRLSLVVCRVAGQGRSGHTVAKRCGICAARYHTPTQIAETHPRNRSTWVKLQCPCEALLLRLLQEHPSIFVCRFAVQGLTVAFRCGECAARYHPPTQIAEKHPRIESTWVKLQCPCEALLLRQRPDTSKFTSACLAVHLKSICIRTRHRGHQPLAGNVHESVVSWAVTMDLSGNLLPRRH
mmetsp:Transcript_39686/g.100816  ORF Transcript_39686/g.100816 Transcript_39686/m.100816 type:complete len:223 (+) Transcript_39686:234-902(+)